jgi:Domain of unknown function (DUF4041)/Meiotically up-regulated gene 113
MEGSVFNPPPGWPKPPSDWQPPPGWSPDPRWPPAPEGWELWLPDTDTAPGAVAAARPSPPASPQLPPPGARGSLTEPPPDAPEVGGEVGRLRAEIDDLRRQLATALGGSQPSTGVIELNDEVVLQEVGIYRYHHPLENSEAFRERLQELQQRIKATVLGGTAILASDMFTFNNSLAKGRRMTRDFSKLMLRAYNAEADNCVRALRAGSVLTAVRRLEAAVTSIAKLGAMMEMRVNPAYHSLRIEELELTADFQMMVQQEREEAREERERLREERRAAQELAAERERLDKERAHYVNAIAALAASGDVEQIASLETKLHELDDAIATNDFRTANIRAGYVYVISNRGSLGPNMVKIGMTRRLEPLDRVRELGDASVPFPYDVHALYFSDDAVTLENELHKAFAAKRVNWVNERREFFFATPNAVREVLAQQVGSLLEFNEHPDATEYFQSSKYWTHELGTAD